MGYMKFYPLLTILLLLSGCMVINEEMILELKELNRQANEERILGFKKRCELMGYKADSEEGKKCVLELEKQYVLGSSSASALESTRGSSSIGSRKPCMFNPESERYETCHHVSADGSCFHYGPWCTP